MMCQMVRALGEFTKIIVAGHPTVSYLVPRHYIALHGVKAAELPELAQRYGWTKIIDL